MNASPPVPPNWDTFHNEALQSVAPYHKLEVQPTTDEFGVIAQMVNVPIFRVERVLNTTLWKKFVNERKELLTRKSEDLQLLTSLGLTEREMLRRAQINLNFTSEQSVRSIKYEDNIALLFHGSRSKLDTVLTQGLDDRLGNGGTHGRGIYFSDSAQTSVGFDSNGALLIVAVFLGDCYSVDKLGRQGFVREPEKAVGQKRNLEDLFFDSIVARRGGAGTGGSNEFIIFNRNQCCPLYVITHRATSAGSRAQGRQVARIVAHLRGGQTVASNLNPSLSHGAAPTQNAPAVLPIQSAEFTMARNSLPPFVWTQSNGGGRLSPNHNQWPFFARTLFDLMKNDEVELRASPSASSAAGGPDEGERARKISKLVDLGFGDVDNNARVLEKFQFNLEAAIDHMLATQSVSGAGGAGVEEWEDASHLFAQVSLTFTLADFVADELFDVADLYSEITDESGVRAVPVSGSNCELSFQATAGASSAQGNQITKTANQLNSPTQSSTSVIMNNSEDCPICYVEYQSDSSFWLPLACSHKLCTSCHSRLETRRATMSGQSHVFLKCPFCQACSGLEVGDCPIGRMTVSQLASTLPGYEQYGTQVLTYSVQSSQHHLSRTAYLPSSPEGLRLIDLLRIAWDRRLIFSVGTSLTTGAQNTLVWNIHHKTCTHGGVQLHGYPDPTYLERLRDELKQYGIE